MMDYIIDTDFPEKEALWEMIQDCAHEFFGDDGGVVDADSFLDWLKRYAEYPLFGYMDGKLFSCSYLCGTQPGFKAAIHCFSHPDYRTPEIMIPASRTVLGLYFKELDLQKLEGVVPEYNRPARLFDLRIGMKKDGRFREHFLYQGKMHDCILYTILRSEFYGQ